MEPIRKIAVRSGVVAVRDRGEGRPVLLIHGIPGSGGAWAPVADALQGAGARTLCPDLLGFGASSRPDRVDDLWLEAQADALADVLRASLSDPVTVVGHDYGAPIAVMLATRHPSLIAGIVLAAGNLFTNTPIPLPLRGVVLPRLGPMVARGMFSVPSLRMMMWVGSGRPRPRLDPSVYLGDDRQLATIRSIFETALRELPTRYAAVEAALPHLGSPTAVIWGDRDPFFPLALGRRAAEAVRGELLVARGAGHFLPAERPWAFVEAVARVYRSPS